MRPQEEAEGGAPMEQETVLELFDRYADMVYRIALSYLRSPQEAEDVVQTVFLKLLEGGMIVYPGKERAFLTKVTINHCKNLLTAVKKHEAIPLDEAVLLIQPEDRDIFYAVMELPEKYRAVVSLHYFEGYSFREISEFFHRNVLRLFLVGGKLGTNTLPALLRQFQPIRNALEVSLHINPSQVAFLRCFWPDAISWKRLRCRCVKIDLKISCAVDCRRCCYDDGINADRCRSGGCASVQK